jgi:2-keto-4-pentenoate hydratase/2-oxohepta-3-ene-1,7-dioic acid hydratase in catechol pathway
VCVNDVTARELQDKDVQFTRAKGFDTFCPVGPCIATGPDLGRLRVEGRVNGQVRQRGSTEQLIFPLEYLVWFVSRVMTLLPGDIISTDTPAGIGPLQGGDVVEVEVEGVGVLRQS